MTVASSSKGEGSSRSVDEAELQALVEEAEKGYDPDELLQRRQGGRPAMGSGPAAVESVRLDPELKRDLLLRAAKDGVSVSEVIRDALRKYVKAS